MHLERLEDRLVPDGTPPTVLSTTSSLLGGSLLAGTTSLQVTFSEPVASPTGSGGDQVANYELRSRGADALLGTADDAIVALSLSYSGTRATLSFASLAEGGYRLTVRDAIQDAKALALDGDENGTAGGNYVRDFVVLPLPNLLRTLGNPTAASGDQFGGAVAASGNFVLVGARFDDTGGSDAGAAYLLDATSGALLRTFQAPTPQAGAEFGSSVAFVGDRVLIGAESHDTTAGNAGTAYLFEAFTGTLAHTFTKPGTAVANDLFGSSVALAAGYVLIGARGSDTGATDAGSAYLFDPTTGGLLQTLNNPSPENGDEFGGSVSLSANLALIGARLDNTGATDAGAAYLFNTATGGLLRTFNNPTPEAGDSFGAAVAVSDHLVLIGASSDNTGAMDAGAAYQFDITGALLRTLNNPSPEVGDAFGGFVALSGNVALVAAASDNTGATDAGSAYLFEGTTGNLLRTFNNPAPAGEALNDQFGQSVALAGDRVVVGARLGRTAAVADAGSVVVFGAQLTLTSSGITPQGFANPTPAVGDSFGVAVAVSGNFVVVGASADDTGAMDAGSAYVFDGTTGALLRTFNNPSPGIEDFFGHAVAVAGNMVLVGAPFSGVINAGAAYLFNASTGALLHTFNNPTPAASDLFGFTVAVAGNLVLVGAPFDDTGATDAGAAYLFNATTGALLRTLNNPTPAMFDQFALSVAVAGNLALVGTPFDDSPMLNAGTAYLFDATTGALLRTLNNPSPAPFDHFGFSVAIAGNSVMVGAPANDTGNTDAGSAYLFDATTGALLRTFDNPTPEPSDSFGQTVGVVGNQVLVAAPQEDTGTADTGLAYLFDATTGVLLRTFTNPTPAVGDLFGEAVGFSGNLIVVGAKRDDTGAAEAGGAYLFNSQSSPTAAGGFNFDVQVSGAGAGQLVHGTDNAFDGLNRLRVGSSDYAPLAQTILLDDGDRTLPLPAQLLSGLTVSREITVPTGSSEIFARTVDVFTNLTGSPITTTVRFVGNLGSEGAISVFSTSDGDTLVETTDQWIGTDDADGSGSPAIIHYIHGPTGLQPTTVARTGDNIEWTYNITVNAGQTLRLAHFTILANTRASVVTAANVLVTPTGFGGQATFGLTTAEVQSLANFPAGTGNQAPTDIALAPSSVPENSSTGTVVGMLTTTDPNPGDTHTYQLVNSAGGRFQIVGSQVQVANGTLLDFETTTSHTIRVRTTDAGGLQFEKDLTITVTNVNEAPTISNIPDQTTPVDTPLGPINFTVGDPETAAASLTVTATSSNQTVVPNANLMLGGSGPNRTLTITPASGQSGMTTITVTVSDGTLMTNDTFVLTVAGNVLTVTTFTPTPTGFTVRFSHPVDFTVLNLYDTQTGGLGLPDVTITGSSTGPVRGSLVQGGGATPDPTTIIFVRTGGVLQPDTYTVTLRSASNGFRNPTVGLLDGNRDGVPGDAFTTNFTVSASSEVVVSVPDFMRGPGQTVNVPATGTGVPLRLSDGAGVTSVTLTLRYDSRLLNITAAAPAPGTPGGATANLTTPSAGVAMVSFSSPTALAAGARDFVTLTATVPNNAPYTTKQLLDLMDVRINTTIVARDDDGLHVAGYFGDTTGNAGYSSADALRVVRVAVGLDSGFIAYQLADPVVIADVTGNGVLNSTDGTRILQESLAIDRPEIPALPGVIPPILPGGPDPLLNIPTTFIGTAGGTITVPVNLDISDGLEIADLALAYDTSRLEVLSDADIRPGSLTADFDLFAINHDRGAGTLRVGLGRSAGPLEGRGTGSVLQITFRIKAGAPDGKAIINLLEELAPTRTALNEGGLVLNPVPSDEAGDALDGLITVQHAPARVEKVAINEAQRSRVISLRVIFSTLVTIDEGAFVLVQGDQPSRARLKVSTSEVEGRTVATLTFRGRGMNAKSLSDGEYTLRIRGDHVRDALGAALDGDDDNEAGGDYLDHFFRRYGDDK